MVDGCTNGLAVRLNRTFADIIITTASPAVAGCAATPGLSVIVAIYTNAGTGGKSDVDWAIGIEQSVFQFFLLSLRLALLLAPVVHKLVVNQTRQTVWPYLLY